MSRISVTLILLSFFYVYHFYNNLSLLSFTCKEIKTIINNCPLGWNLFKKIMQIGKKIVYFTKFSSGI